jgi:hypothetical protein
MAATAAEDKTCRIGAPGPPRVTTLRHETIRIRSRMPRGTRPEPARGQSDTRRRRGNGLVVPHEDDGRPVVR